MKKYFADKSRAKSANSRSDGSWKSVQVEQLAVLQFNKFEDAKRFKDFLHSTTTSHDFHAPFYLLSRRF